MCAPIKLFIYLFLFKAAEEVNINYIDFNGFSGTYYNIVPDLDRFRVNMFFGNEI